MTVLETDRLILRRLTVDDAPLVVDLLNQPSFLRFIGDKGVRTLEDARQYILTGPVASYARHGFGQYLVERRQDGAAVGICGLMKRDGLADVDIGFALLPRFWSQGYAIEAASAVMAYATTVLRLPRVVAIAQADNLASIRVLGKLHLVLARTIRLRPDDPEIGLYEPAVPSATRRPDGVSV